MYFLLSAERGKGVGKQLLQYGIENYGIQELTVNEQNPQAVGFYRHMGFKRINGRIMMRKEIHIHCYI